MKNLKRHVQVHVKILMRSIFLLFMFVQPALALNASIEKLVRYETQANAVAVRSQEMILLPHVELPIEYVGHDFALRIDERIAQSLVFEKDGKKIVRWILNPEDTKWGNELIKYFKKTHGLELTRQFHFHGYQTSSRSYIAEDPTNGAQFSVKSSTNVTGGMWRDKKQPVGEAIDSRLISDFLYRQSKKRPFQNFVFLDEPAILSLDAIDQAVVIRDLNVLKRADSKRYYLPGFSAVHESVGQEIALLNGSDNPYKYWTKNYIEVAGRALGELAARTGLQFDSPHSQNFLIELDEKLKPTGRLVLRDMADIYVDKNFVEAIEGKDSNLLMKFTQKSNIQNGIEAGFGPLHGNTKPAWVDEARYSQWKNVFFSEFEKTFKDISGFDISSLRIKKYQSGDYFSASYNLAREPSFKEFFNQLRAEGFVRNSSNGLMCSRIFSKAN